VQTLGLPTKQATGLHYIRYLFDRFRAALKPGENKTGKAGNEGGDAVFGVDVDCADGIAGEICWKIASRVRGINKADDKKDNTQHCS